MPPVRRLAAILAADVAGYSRLMGADEEGTHERLRAHLRELIEPKIAEHRGRIVKNTGDGFLAEFASVVDAVRCAVAMQRGMADRNAGTPLEQRIEFRVGINLGDVIAEGEDIFGDGVNVAARLQALAEPGGICVSRVCPRPGAGQAGLHFRGHGRAAGQEHRSASAGLCPAPRAYPGTHTSGCRRNPRNRLCTAPINSRPAVCQFER
jgi:class 3 adenylate cyclase